MERLKKESMSVKKVIVFTVCIILLLLLFLLLFLVCTIPNQTIPYGIWQSEDPNITLYINHRPLGPDGYQYNEPDNHPWYGTYLKDGVEIDVVIYFAPTWNRFSIVDAVFGYSPSGSYRFSYYFSGDYKLRGNRMIYTLTPHWREQTGIKRIVFEKIGDIDIP